MAKEMNNRQAYFNYHIEDKYVAGIVLMGTEVKSIREGKVSFADSYCMFDKGELWVRGLNIAEYSHGAAYNHTPVHDRKLLLTSRELKRLGSNGIKSDTTGVSLSGCGETADVCSFFNTLVNIRCLFYKGR